MTPPVFALAPHGVLLRIAAGLLVLALGLGSGGAQAQDAGPTRESAVKAAFLYRFTGFVDWPVGALGAGQPLVIGVLDDESVAADLEHMVQGRKVQDRPVVVWRVPSAARARDAHVLYVGRRNPARLRETLAALPPGPLLVVTDQDEAHPPGAALNFVQDDGRLRFTASPRAAEARSLRLAARLLNVAKAVEERTP
ncbi:YfiR family protein [Ramlibacter rhizophilus]|uniref:YfiR family protein n=1 Tax=Ramlibacter rhizophilus TaxID=1781167 RepID=UPI0014327165|nr:YfiR family protein [Ramlibacter rhizophilus]